MDNTVDDFILAAIRELGGATRLVPGARIASAASRLAAQEGIDFRAALRSAGLKLGDAVRAIAAKDHNIQFQPQEGSDFLAGLATAEGVLAEKKPERIRKDLYDAFTRVGPQLYYYPDRDVLSPEKAASAISVPCPTTGDAIALRRDFAVTMASEPVKRQLDEALGEPRPLTAFSKAVTVLGLTTLWRNFLQRQVHSMIQKWAAENSLMLRAEWFGRPSTAARHKESSVALRDVLASLSDEELERVFVPLRVFADALARRSTS